MAEETEVEDVHAHDAKALDEDDEDAAYKHDDYKKRRKKKHEDVTSHETSKEKGRKLKEKSEDMGPKPFYVEVTDEMLSLMKEGAELIGFDALLAYVHAIKYRNSTLEGPVKGVEYQLTGNMIDSWIEYMNVMINDRKKLEDLLKQMVTIREEAFGKERGLIGKTIKKTTDLADTTSRTLTKNVVKLKPRKELR
jgi:hypothetical protein